MNGVRERLRGSALDIFHHGLKAVDPRQAVERNLRLEEEDLLVGDRRYNLGQFERIFVIGAGKASTSMASGVERVLGDRIDGGVIVTKYGYLAGLERVEAHQAGHPIPDQAGVEGTRRMLDLLSQTGKDDLVLCLISGGGSALLLLPAEGISLEEKQQVTQVLLQCGATIDEINAIRKHTSSIKGGQLARMVFPATLVTLILSDVVGDRLDVIASGPTVPDESTFADCLAIVDKYALQDRIPRAILNRLRAGWSDRVPETPKPEDPVFKSCQNLVVGSNRLAVEAAYRRAAELGFNPLTISTFVEGETREVAKVHTAMAKEVLSSGSPVPPPACLISGGETTVTIRGKGIGGRNQEFALAAALGIDGLEGVVILSAGTDGTDGPTDAAGAIADWRTVEQARGLGLDAQAYLDDSDSHRFFQQLNDLVVTGPTGTNVMDLRLMLVAKTGDDPEIWPPFPTLQKESSERFG